MSAIKSVIDQYGQRQQTVSVAWPGWAVHMATLAGRVGSYEIVYRNPDWREYEEQRNHDFAAWAKDRDYVEQFAADARRLEANKNDENSCYYVRCSNCGSVNIDPVIRVSDEVPA